MKAQRKALTDGPESAYFDLDSDTEVFTDASPVGIAAVLAQRKKGEEKREIIAYPTFLSRHPLSDEKLSNRQEKVAEEFVNYVTQNSVPRTISRKNLEEATSKDITLRAVIHAIETENLREKVVNIAHEGHMGMSKMKALLREKVRFPRIDELVNGKVKSCLPCQITTPVREKEPLKMSELPRSPWKELSMDFGVAPTGTGEYLFVLYDDFSRYPIVEVIRSTAATTVIPCLDKILSDFGIPDTIRSDNGPPFNSKEFYEFSKYLGFKLRKVTPYWPRANGEVERLMHTIKKTIKAAIMEGKYWKQEIHRILRNYRATPHSSTKISPFMALFGRPMKKDTTNNQQQTPYDGKPREVVERKGSIVTAKKDRMLFTRNSSFFKKLENGKSLEEPIEESIKKKNGGILCVQVKPLFLTDKLKVNLEIKAI
ncbi:uncharacterized protein K02A2.6-like [Xenia sp. Carnegie-2017]|uniref:uncharacterized protein K02A2.6-like n=1 Tax=Xenia sp. Carnegie-2017 TaxID=2897299 RepID=UPI001F04E919|nr:uncharacterized protein K02A2.6-like [Xenia sp. Carnegie-2017]